MVACRTGTPALQAALMSAFFISVSVFILQSILIRIYSDQISDICWLKSFKAESLKAGIRALAYLSQSRQRDRAKIDCCFVKQEEHHWNLR